MNNNIKGIIHNGKPAFETVSTAEVTLPTMVFNRYEDAELAVSIAKALQARFIKDFDALLHGIKYTFRILGFNDSLWVE